MRTARIATFDVRKMNASVLIVDDRLNSNGARCAPPGTGSGEFRSSSTGIYNLK